MPGLQPLWCHRGSPVRADPRRDTVLSQLLSQQVSSCASSDGCSAAALGLSGSARTRRAALTCSGLCGWHPGLAAAAWCLVPKGSKQSWPDVGWSSKGEDLLPSLLWSSAVGGFVSWRAAWVPSLSQDVSCVLSLGRWDLILTLHPKSQHASEKPGSPACTAAS